MSTEEAEEERLRQVRERNRALREQQERLEEQRQRQEEQLVLQEEAEEVRRQAEEVRMRMELQAQMREHTNFITYWTARHFHANAVYPSDSDSLGDYEEQ
jgi:hypothetical protein